MKANQVNRFSDPLLQTELENIYRILNTIGLGSTFSQRGENVDAFLMEATANATAGNDTQITHDLRRVPIGFLVLSQSGSGDFYDGTGTNSETNFFIKCTTASTRFRIAIL